MAEPVRGPLDRADELLYRIGQLLRESAPDGWARLDLRAALCATQRRLVLTAVLADGSTHPVSPVDDLHGLLADLRHLTYRPGEGAWFSARYAIHTPDQASMIYNYDHDPRWDPALPAAVFARDLAQFPRGQAHMPRWLRAALGDSSSLAAGTYPPAPFPHRDTGRDELLRGITLLLAAAAPPDWQRMELECRAAGRHLELAAALVTVNGVTRAWTPPPEARRLFAELRMATHRPGSGTWATARLRVEHPARYAAEFDDTAEPRWTAPPPRQAFIDELRMFPRAPMHTPGWLRDRAGVPGATASSAATAAQGSSGRLRPVGLLESGVLDAGPDGHPPAGGPLPVNGVSRASWSRPGLAVPARPEAAVNGTPVNGRPVNGTPMWGAPVSEIGASETGASGHEAQVVATLRRRLAELGVRPDEYAIGGPVTAPRAKVLQRSSDGTGWEVATQRWDMATVTDVVRFPDVTAASAYLLGSLLLAPQQDPDQEQQPQRAPSTDDAAAVASVSGTEQPVASETTPASSFRPLAGEPPLSLFAEREIVTLPAGTEIDRFGEPSGNLTYAAGTEYASRSLPPQWRRRAYHAYRLQRTIQAIRGVAVPWFGQPGGGTGYLLPRSIIELLADGTLAEIGNDLSESVLTCSNNRV